MPIKNISGESIGVTQMINRRGGPFGPDDEKILSSFSAQGKLSHKKRLS
jgi:adenylate cyclase